MKKQKKLFKTLDLNKDGKLEEQEIIIGLKKLRLPSDKVQQFIQEADEDKDGKLSENDFVNWFHQREKYLKQLFDIFDTDHNGHLDEKELKKVLSKLGYHANEKQVHSLLKRLDLDCNGTVEFNEFCAILMLAPLKNPENVVEFWQKVVSIDIGEDFYIPPENKGIRALKYLISGGIAGAVSRTCTAPLDRLKILLQTQSNKKNYSGIIQGLLKIKKEEGILGFWRANGINVLKIFPESGIRFLGYEYYKKLLFNHSEISNLSPYQKLMAGGFAGITSQFIIYPLEVARSRLAISPKNTYKGIIDVFKKMIKKEGPKSLYRGLLPSLLGIMPYAAIDLAIYDMLKTKYIYYQKKRTYRNYFIILWRYFKFFWTISFLST
jgi:solute carrier family 25 phosphate transporter 23/24/25/41